MPQPQAPVALADLAAAAGLAAPAARVTVTGITHDNRMVEPGWIFAALPGANRHGSEFAAAAVAAGAAAVLTDAAGAAHIGALEVPVLVSLDPRAAMGEIARHLSGDAQARLSPVGVTGTNGKTTTTHMIAAMLEQVGRRPLLVGTVGTRFAGVSVPAARTTPEASDLHRLLGEAAAQGADSVVMEVSSHAMVLQRVSGMHFAVAVFTGLSQDHLDFHADMEDYFAAKAGLFTPGYCRRGVVCVDDEWGRRLAASADVPVTTYSVTGAADWTAELIEVTPDGRSRFTAVGPGVELPVELSMPGDFNIANALAALAVLSSLALDLPAAAAALADVRVPGRLERVECGQDYTVLVDYAHTPDAVSRALAVGRDCAAGRLIAVLGCGGDRDRAKRPLMGAAAASAADLVIVTDDNPRSEVPAEIRAAIIAGAGTAAALREIGDRRAAIQAACQLARPGDCIVILGKGHETGQEEAGVVRPFDDRLVAAEAITAGIDH